MRLKYKVGLILVVLSLAICFMTYQSYALWVKDMVAEQDNIVDVGCFTIEFVDNNSISLSNSYPVNDQKGLSGIPYTFTITNTCSIDDNYIITLNTINTNNYPAGSVVIGYDNKGAEILENYNAFNMKNKIKFALSEGSAVPTAGTNLGVYATEENLNKDLTELSDIANLEESIILANGTLKGKTSKDGKGETKTYNLYLWFDAEAGNEIMNKSFNASINIIHNAFKIELYQPFPTNVFANVIDEEVGTGVPDENGNGLYKVTHDDLTNEDNVILASDVAGWQKIEYRYAGPNPDNYVKFNNELWRIIGLVNVKVNKGNGRTAIEQRLKIIRNGKLESDKQWDSYKINDWTQSTLMKYLNVEEYYTEQLQKEAKDMIDTDIIWNIGGSIDYEDITINMYYKRERGNIVFETDPPRPTEWKMDDTNRETYHSIALPYASDYGYATSGGTLGRKECFKKEVHNWREESDGDYSPCAQTDWLIPTNDSYMWLLTPDSFSEDSSFLITNDGYDSYRPVNHSNGVWPTLYLSSSVILSSSTENSESPIGSETNPYILTME